MANIVMGARKSSPYIESFSYPFYEEESIVPMIHSGRTLPPGAGFGYRLDAPTLSFKGVKACYRASVGGYVQDILKKNFRSTVTKNNVWNSILDFAKPTVHRPTEFKVNYEKALELLKKEISVESKLDPIPMEEGVKLLPQSTSAGLPFITSCPGLKKGDIFDRFLKGFHHHWSRIGSGLPCAPPPDCAAFCRSHISEVEKNKVRPDWAFPALVIAEESRFGMPLLKEMTDQEICPHVAYGMEILKGGMAWLNSKLCASRRRCGWTKILMLDYSSFDSTIPAWLLRDIFNIIEEKFNLTPEDRRRFKKIVDYFINTPVQNMDGRRFKKDHGIPSGSLFTNIIGSFANFVIINTIIPLVIGEMDFYQVLGDDSVISMPEGSVMDLEMLSKAGEKIFGITVNTQKSYWTNNLKNVHFLGYYNFFGEPIKPLKYLISELIFPERKDYSWSMELSRVLGLLLSSAGNTPSFFHVAREMYNAAVREEPLSIHEALDMMANDPRIVRDVNRSGAHDWKFTADFFSDYSCCYPRLDCTKILKQI